MKPAARGCALLYSSVIDPEEQKICLLRPLSGNGGTWQSTPDHIYLPLI